MKRTFTGGFRIGKNFFSCINGTYPLAKLRIEDKIYLKVGIWIFSKTYVFELDEVLMKVGVLALADSMLVVHDNPKYPSHIYFHSFNLKEISELLKSKGVRVEVYEKTLSQKILKTALKIFVRIFLIVWVSGFLFGLGLLACRLLGLI